MSPVIDNTLARKYQIDEKAFLQMCEWLDIDPSHLTINFNDRNDGDSLLTFLAFYHIKSKSIEFNFNPIEKILLGPTLDRLAHLFTKPHKRMDEFVMQNRIRTKKLPKYIAHCLLDPGTKERAIEYVAKLASQAFMRDLSRILAHELTHAKQDLDDPNFLKYCHILQRITIFPHLALAPLVIFLSGKYGIESNSLVTWLIAISSFVTGLPIGFSMVFISKIMIYNLIPSEKGAKKTEKKFKDEIQLHDVFYSTTLQAHISHFLRNYPQFHEFVKINLPK